MHGTINGRSPGRGPGSGDEPTLRLIFRILFREAVAGLSLYVLVGQDPRSNVVAFFLVFAILLILTSRYGLLRHRTRLDVLTECLVVFMGALAFRNVLLILSSLLV